MGPETIERFWAKVRTTSEERCWLWTASVNRGGYGQIGWLSDGKQVTRLAHRFSYAMHVGEIPDGLCVLHKCDTPACVNPGHLFLGTNADNMRDMTEKGRQARGERSGGGTPKLARADVVNIRQEYAAGTSQAELGRKYSVSQQQVGRIVHRITWAHVE